MEIALLCVYAGMLAHLSRKDWTKGDAAGSFFVNNRASGAASVAFSLIVSCVGASATMGMAGMAFAIGTPAFWWLGSGAAGLVILATLVAEKVRKSGSFTMPEMVDKLLGPGARPLISVIIVVGWLAILAAQFSALSKLLAALIGFSPLPCLAIGYFLAVMHTMGGQAVVIRTDRLQFFILAAGLVVLYLWLDANNPGWTEGLRIEAVNDRFTIKDLLRYAAVIGGNYVVCPMLYGRILSARDATAARNGSMLAGAGIALCGLLIVAVGLSCRGLLPADTVPDAVLTTAVSTVFPRWLAVVVLLALISAVVSSADSCLVTAATVLGYDLLRTPDASICRKCVATLGCLGAALTFMNRGILDFLFMAYDVFVSGVAMPVFIALLFSGKRTLRPGFSVVAIVIGGTLGCAAAVTGDFRFSFTGILLSTAITMAGLLPRGGKQTDDAA